MKKTGILLCISMVVCLGFQPATAQERRPKSGRVPQAKGAGKTVKKKEARAVIESLVNRNPVPVLVGDSGEAVAIFDAKYNWAEYDRVWDDLHGLARDAEALWPELVKHLDDDRYCMTVKVLDHAVNWTVGDVCRELIAATLAAAYHRHGETRSKESYNAMYWPEFVRDAKTLKVWCEARRDRKPYELQVERCRWAIGKLREPGALREVPAAAKRAWTRAIEAEMESLQKSKKAVPSHWFHSETYTAYTAEEARQLRKEHLRKNRKGTNE